MTAAILAIALAATAPQPDPMGSCAPHLQSGVSRRAYSAPFVTQGVIFLLASAALIAVPDDWFERDVRIVAGVLATFNLGIGAAIGWGAQASLDEYTACMNRLDGAGEGTDH